MIVDQCLTTFQILFHKKYIDFFLSLSFSLPDTVL